MKSLILSALFLVSLLSQAVPGKIIFADGKVIVVPDEIVILNNTIVRAFVQEKSEPAPPLNPAQEVARARMFALYPKAVLPGQKIKGESLDPRQSKEMAVNKEKDEQPIKVNGAISLSLIVFSLCARV